MVKKQNTLLVVAAATLIIIFALLFFIYLNKLTFQNKDDVEIPQNQSSSTEIGDIEKDLQNTDLENIDKELEDIGNELGM